MSAVCKEIVTEVIDAFAMAEKIVFSLFIETSEVCGLNLFGIPHSAKINLERSQSWKCT